MLQDKVNLFDNEGSAPKSNGANADKSLYSGAYEDKLQAKITKIFQSGDIDNKEKIAQMVKIYDEEIIIGYKQTFKDVVYNTSEETLNEYLVEFTKEKANIGDNILQKY